MRTLSFDKMIDNLADLKKLDLSDPYNSACGVIFALAMFERDEAVAREMFEYINGPEDMGAFDYDFIKNQLRQYPYVVRSYFEDTSPENNYMVNNVGLTIVENDYSRAEDGYIKLWLKSSGADSERSVTLRLKKSTNEWFLFSDSYRGLLAGIRVPAREGKWS